MNGRIRRRVCDRVELPFAEIEALGLFPVEWPRATAVEHRQLVAALIDRTVAIDTFRDGESRPLSTIRSDQLWSRTRAEAEIIRVIVRREKLHNAHPIPAVR